MADVSRIGACGVTIAILIRRSRRTHRNQSVGKAMESAHVCAYHQLMQQLRLSDIVSYRHF